MVEIQSRNTIKIFNNDIYFTKNRKLKIQGLTRGWEAYHYHRHIKLEDSLHMDADKGCTVLKQLPYKCSAQNRISHIYKIHLLTQYLYDNEQLL